MDPITYFLSYARLAPVQVRFKAHRRTAHWCMAKKRNVSLCHVYVVVKWDIFSHFTHSIAHLVTHTFPALHIHRNRHSNCVISQAAWMAHPDSTGVQNIDYFLSSSVELPNADTHYSEKLYRMSGLGTVLIDLPLYSSLTPAQHSSPRTALLDRARIIEQIGLPRAAHLYIIAQPLYRLHSKFDHVLSRILLQVRLC